MSKEDSILDYYMQDYIPTKICPVCKEIINKNLEECTHCLKKQQENLNKTRKCPYCDAFIAPYREICLSCNKLFTQPEYEEQKNEQEIIGLNSNSQQNQQNDSIHIQLNQKKENQENKHNNDDTENNEDNIEKTQEVVKLTTTKQCSECLLSNDVLASECKFCKVKLENQEQEESAQILQPQQQIEKKSGSVRPFPNKICSNCKSSNSFQLTFCLKCKKPFDKQNKLPFEEQKQNKKIYINNNQILEENEQDELNSNHNDNQKLNQQKWQNKIKTQSQSSFIVCQNCARNNNKQNNKCYKCNYNLISIQQEEEILNKKEQEETIRINNKTKNYYNAYFKICHQCESPNKFENKQCCFCYNILEIVDDNNNNNKEKSSQNGELQSEQKQSKNNQDNQQFNDISNRITCSCGFDNEFTALTCRSCDKELFSKF